MSNYSHYAVRRGRRPGIYESWAEAAEQVLGFSRPVFKGFNSREGAEAFMAGQSLAEYREATLRQDRRRDG